MTPIGRLITAPQYNRLARGQKPVILGQIVTWSEEEVAFYRDLMFNLVRFADTPSGVSDSHERE
jgi:hypothetical protein